ncbi:ankyrin repeat-containing domain protein [Halenospora varia]|nr:ankyrin repeat-containing domain protein [Halenospora varia]
MIFIVSFLRLTLTKIGIPYNALSYTWGSNDRDRAITIDRRTLYITSNLYHALHYLRLEGQDRILWIDALCIDQNNEREKGHQVAQMGRIYKEAEQVIMWLGRPTPESDLAMDSMKRMVEGNNEAEWRSLARARLQHEQLPCGALSHGLTFMLNQPWFRRIWILQEVANARVAIVQCGNKSISSRIFAQAPALMGMAVDSNSQAVLDIMPGFSRKESWWAERRDLQTLLFKFQECEATDKRDMIYALLNMSSDAQGSDIIVPDYTKSLSEVLETTRLFLLSAPKQVNHYLKTKWKLSTGTIKEFLLDLDKINDRVLGLASQEGNLEDVKVVLAKRGINVNSVVDGETPVHRASRGGYEAVVEFLLQHGASITTTDEINESPLLLAAGEGYMSIVKILIRHGADIDATDREGISPLQKAAESGRTGMVKLLLEHGAIIKTTDPSYSGMLQRGIEKGQTRIVELLLEHCGVIETMDERYSAIFRMAIETGQTRIVELLLLLHGADVEMRGPHDSTPLHMAAYKGHQDIVRVLLEHGANIEAMNLNHQTPLQSAAQNKHAGVVQVLLNHGAKLPVLLPFEKQQYYTLLCWAMEGLHINVLENLLTCINEDHSWADLLLQGLWRELGEANTTMSASNEAVDKIMIECGGRPRYEGDEKYWSFKPPKKLRWWKGRRVAVTKKLF